MAKTVLRNIPGRDIPPQWLESNNGQIDQTYILIIQPEKEFLQTSESNRQNRNKVFDLLEGVSGNESSEEWIDLIKSLRTKSPLKAKFNGS